MKIRELMIADPITISATASIRDALELMKVNSIRHLPVVGKNNRLDGFLTLADVKQGLIPSMVADVSLSDLVISNPIVVDPDDDIETAARLIYHHKISGLPVVKNGMLAGIITETDLLRAFIDMMGLLSTTSRIDVVVGDRPDAVTRVIHIINNAGGDIINMGMTGQNLNERTCYFRLSACKTAPIREALQARGFAVLAAMD